MVVQLKRAVIRQRRRVNELKLLGNVFVLTFK